MNSNQLSLVMAAVVSVGLLAAAATGAMARETGDSTPNASPGCNHLVVLHIFCRLSSLKIESLVVRPVGPRIIVAQSVRAGSPDLNNTRAP